MRVVLWVECVSVRVFDVCVALCVMSVLSVVLWMAGMVWKLFNLRRSFMTSTNKMNLFIQSVDISRDADTHLDVTL